MKKGSYYEVNKHSTNIFEKSEAGDYRFGEIYIALDSESKHLESNVHNILDIIGTIGGSFELVHYIIFIIYCTFRQNLYFYSMIKGIGDFKKSQDKVDIKKHKSQLDTSRRNHQDVKNRRERNYEEHDESKHELAPNENQNQIQNRDVLLNKLFGVNLAKEESAKLVRK